MQKKHSQAVLQGAGGNALAGVPVFAADGNCARCLCSIG